MAVAGGLAIGCSHAPGPETAAGGGPRAKAQTAAVADHPSQLPGISGMARVDRDRYLVVHDTKVGRPGPRLGWLTIDGEVGARYRAIDLETDSAAPPPNDLEGVCSLGETWGAVELLLHESGPWNGVPGRLFHLTVPLADEPEVELVRTLELPSPAAAGETGDENYEGIACVRTADGRVLVLLGERGGSAAYPRGVVRWGYYDPWGGELAFSDTGRRGVTVQGPFADERARSISGLHLTATGDLWASATEDPGDLGPFRSALYRIGRVDPEREAPLELESEIRASCWIEGYKIEAIATDGDDAATLAIGSEDETLGGTWRRVRCTP